MILGWINTYRHNPDPDRVPVAVRGMSRLGLITDPEGSGVYVGFLAGIIAANPDRADVLIGKMFPLSPEHHWAIVRAIAYSGHPDWRMLMQRVADRMPARGVMMDRYLAGKLPRLDEAPIEKDETWGEKVRGQFTVTKYFSKPATETKLALTPDLLDTLWGYYYATGSYQPLSRIVLMLRWSKDRDAIEKLTLGSMAKYTLAINATRNPDLLAKLKWAADAGAAGRRQADPRRGDRGRRNGRDRQAAQRGARRDRRAAPQGSGLQARHFAVGAGGRERARAWLHRGGGHRTS